MPPLWVAAARRRLSGGVESVVALDGGRPVPARSVVDLVEVLLGDEDAGLLPEDLFEPLLLIRVEDLLDDLLAGLGHFLHGSLHFLAINFAWGNYFPNPKERK